MSDTPPSSGDCNGDELDELDERDTARAELVTAVAEHDAALSAVRGSTAPGSTASIAPRELSARYERARNRVIRAAQALAYLGA